MLSANVLAAVLEFRRERDWEVSQAQGTRRRHDGGSKRTAGDLSMEIARRGGPLLESPSRARVEDEIADVVILLSYLCHDLGLDVNAAVLEKLKKNEAKYPVEKSYGNARKYDG